MSRVRFMQDALRMSRHCLYGNGTPGMATIPAMRRSS